MKYVKAGLARCAISLMALVALLIGLKFLQELAPPWPSSDGAAFVLSVAELFRALQWPLVAIIIAMVFKKEVATLLGKVKSGKFPLIGEIEFQEDLSDLKRAATEFSKNAEDSNDQTVTTTSPMRTEDEAPKHQSRSDADDTHRSQVAEKPAGDAEQLSELKLLNFLIALQNQQESLNEKLEALELGIRSESQSEIARVSAISPRAAMMLLSTEIDNTLKLLLRLVDSPKAFRIRNPAPTQVARFLATTGLVDPATADGVQKFWRVRNAVVHEGMGDNEEIVSAIDAGLDILRSLHGRLPESGYLFTHVSQPD